MTLRLRLLAAAASAMVAATLLTSGSPAAAATADRFGFALVDNPTVPAWTALNPGYQYGSWAPGPVATGAKVATGRFLVRFPNVASGTAGNVHVTAVAADGRFCESVGWGSSGLDELVDVACFKPGGVPADTPFTVLWTVSSGVLPAGVGSYSSVRVVSGALAQSYNSTGSPVVVTGLSLGVYSVRFAGVGTAGVLSGNVQVTAQQPNAMARRCKILRWGISGTDVIVYVACFDPATGAPTASDFTASYHRERSVYASFAPPKYFGYLATPFPGTPTNYSYPLGVGPNGWSPSGTGTYTVKFPVLHQKATTSHLTAIGDGPAYCTIAAVWLAAGSDAVVPVACFTNTGAPDKSDFSIAFASSV
ncbi:hypothetical protein AB0M46_18195 [Dactylosporangium sp. NPDC051485]|uniref:hypothetical protein n=1 Tax=Dactylosporangium sp. NPDC051485 TaxID=3154846 RepID=UPI00343E44CC